MAFDRKRNEYSTQLLLRDIRPLYVRFGDWLTGQMASTSVLVMGAGSFVFLPQIRTFSDIVFICFCLMFWWLRTRDRSLPVKLPMGSPYKDGNNMGPGGGGKPEGILYLGNDRKTGEELWFSNSDVRTHTLYLGTTGSGKTEGLKSLATNALAWGSGFVYIDGKADTDLWSSLSALVRRFGRDDDLLVLNYMTGNSDERAPSNTMNPFSSGSASYLANMLQSLMPEAEGDNAMWKERAVSLINTLMPALTWKRDHQDIPLSVTTIRKYLDLNSIIKLSRDEALPEHLRESLLGYLDTLPGYVAEAFDDEGKEKPMGPDQPMVDTTTVRQQHGYLTMQFTRALQSLGDDYGYIFDTQAADIDMVDVVLNRRIVVTLIPALEKSPDETANLGKIIVATLKGMMGSTLGANLEGESSTVIENKPTHSSTPFMTVFDEVGYYTVPGMAVMAAQARSLGFALVFAAQDLQAMEKRIKEEARSITANCNIKIFGKLEDPTQTREFYENQIGKGNVAVVSSFQLSGGLSTSSYQDTRQASVESRQRSDYDDLLEQNVGEAVVLFRRDIMHSKIFYSNPGNAKAMRVTRYLSLPPPEEHVSKHASQITKLRDYMVHKNWTAMNADVAVETPPLIDALFEGYMEGRHYLDDPVDFGICALAALHARQFPEEAAEALKEPESGSVPVPEAPAVPQAEPSTPMGYFASSEPEENVSVTQGRTAPVEQAPVSRDTLVEDASGQAERKAREITYVKHKLDAQIERILVEAGEKARNALFRSGRKDDGKK